MSDWKNFLQEAGSQMQEGQPGKVMVAFVNSFLEGVADLKVKIVSNGKATELTTTISNYAHVFQPIDLTPCEVHIWSPAREDYKLLGTVKPSMTEATLARVASESFAVTATTQPHTEDQTDKSVPKQTQLTAAPPPGPSPADNQGVVTEEKRNARNEPVVQVSRPVPEKITLNQLKKIFPAGSDDHLQAIADELNTDLAKYKLDTAVRRAHFFGQIRRESGSAATGIEESFDYSDVGLINTFGYYATNKKEAKEDGRITEKKDVQVKKYDKKTKTHVWVTQKKDVVTQAAKQETIANKAYGPEPGNAKSLGNDRKFLGDGWKYRGRGLKQVTGRDNYKNFGKDYKNYWPNENKNFEDTPELLIQMPDVVRSAVWFWIQNNCYEKADGGIEDANIDAVTEIVNYGEIKKNSKGSYKDDGSNPVLLRREHAKLAYKAFN